MTVFPRPAASAVKRLLTEAGLPSSDLGAARLESFFGRGSTDDCWQPFLGGQGPAPAYAMSLEESERARLRDPCVLVGAAPRSTSVLLALVLAACTTQQQSSAVDAAATPLRDLNVVHAEIPHVLMEAQQKPYAVPSDQDCAALAASVRALDEVLGPDLDTPASGKNPGLIERGANQAGNAAVGTLRGTAESVVPFRSWVRRLSGAERYSKQVAAAITAGTIRRAFLKGLRASKGCP